MIKIVLDTNQFVSALISPNGASAKILNVWRSGQIEVVVSEHILRELKDVLYRPKIKEKYHLTSLVIEAYLELIRRYAIMTSGNIEVSVISEDSDDDMIIACALEAEVDYVISGDRHLLNLGEYQDIKIIRASDFLLNQVSP